MTITKNSISQNERIILGCSAIAGMSPTEVASEHETNRQSVYDFALYYLLFLQY
jgi:hypothetical protein